jgi:hypothetical protein
MVWMFRLAPFTDFPIFELYRTIEGEWREYIQNIVITQDREEDALSRRSYTIAQYMAQSDPTSNIRLILGPGTRDLDANDLINIVTRNRNNLILVWGSGSDPDLYVHNPTTGMSLTNYEG